MQNHDPSLHWLCNASVSAFRSAIHMSSRFLIHIIFDVAGPSQHKFSETLSEKCFRKALNFNFCGSSKRTILWKFQLEFGKKIGLWTKVKKKILLFWKKYFYPIGVAEYKIGLGQNGVAESTKCNLFFCFKPTFLPIQHPFFIHLYCGEDLILTLMLVLASLCSSFGRARHCQPGDNIKFLYLVGGEAHIHLW